MAAHPKTSKARKVCVGVLLVVSFLLVATLAVNLYLLSSTRTRIFYQSSQLPLREVGLVMGTDLQRSDGSTNVHFLARTAAAVEVYSGGKVKRLLISGSKDNRGFNEVTGIQKRLVASEIPESAMTLDFEGFRTWETVRRAGEVYHLEKVTIITDAFHAPRSIFLCQHFGIDAVVFCPGEEPMSFWSVRSRLREYAARVKAVVDACLDKRKEPNG